MADKVVTYRTDIIEDGSGKYHWVYELPMLKSFFLLFEVWKVLLLAALIVGILLSVLVLIAGDGLKDVLFSF